jgi:hypothetical protein
MAKIERVKHKYTTGKGELVGYLALTKPSSQYGNYAANILLSKEEGEALVTKLKEMRKEQFKLCQNKGTLKDLPCMPYTTYDETSGENVPDKAGRYILKTSNKAFNKDGQFIFRPQFVNAKKEFITGNISAGEGTIAKISVIFEGCKAGANVGISAKLLGGQVINLIEYSNKPSVSLDDFDEEEGFDGIGEEFTEEPTKSEVAPEDDEEELDF